MIKHYYPDWAEKNNALPFWSMPHIYVPQLTPNAQLDKNVIVIPEARIKANYAFVYIGMHIFVSWVRRRVAGDSSPVSSTVPNDIYW